MKKRGFITIFGNGIFCTAISHRQGIFMVRTVKVRIVSKKSVRFDSCQEMLQYIDYFNY